MLAATTVLLLFANYALYTHTQNDTMFNNETLFYKEPPAYVDDGYKKQTPVKLNIKQTLIMNQVVANYALHHAENALCRNHSLEFQKSLRAFEPWALRMFDASSKLQSGIFAGNLMEFGSYEQCVSVYTDTEFGEIKGKQCVIRIQPSEDIVKKILSFRNISERRFEVVRSSMEGVSLWWSVCVPHTCQHDDVLSHFTKTVTSLTEGLDLEISLNELDCAIKEAPAAFSSGEIAVLTFIGVHLTIILLCTIIDVWTGNVPKIKLISIFSVYSNIMCLTSHNEKGSLRCLHGIRFLNIAYVVFGHRYIMTLFFPAVNSLDLLNWLLKYPSTLIIGGTLSVDTYFLLSGLLVSYNFFNHMSDGGSFNILTFYIHRYLRITPSYAVFIAIVATFGQRFGSGPLWKKISMSVVKPCQYFWWSALLQMQNYINPKHICLLQTWYLSNDMLYYLLSPFLLYPLWKWRIFGIINILVVFIISIGANFWLAWTNHYKAGMLVDNNLSQSKFFTTHYIAPHIRASPYIIGIVFGYILHLTRYFTIKMRTSVLVLGWITSATSMIGVIIMNQHYQEETHVYNRLEECLYLAISRSIWSLGIVWIIWACRNGHGGLINSFLSAHIFEVLGRIVYSIFIIHMPFQFLTNGALKLPIYFSNLNSVHRGLGDVGASLLIGIFLTVLVEYPFVRASTLLFKMKKPKIKPVTDETQAIPQESKQLR